MAAEKKGLAALIVAGKAPGVRESDDMEDVGDDEGEESSDEGQLAAADEVISAVNSGDPQAFLDAFKALKELC